MENIDLVAGPEVTRKFFRELSRCTHPVSVCQARREFQPLKAGQKLTAIGVGKGLQKRKLLIDVTLFGRKAPVVSLDLLQQQRCEGQWQFTKQFNVAGCDPPRLW